MKNFIFICLSLILIVSFASCKKGLTNQPIAIDSLKTGLIAYYQFNNSGVDSSGKGNNATGFNLSPTVDRFGKANNAYAFNGLTSYATANDNQDLRLNNTDFTINTWINMTAFNSTSGSYIFAKRSSGVNNGWGFSINGYQTTVGLVGGVYFGPGGGNAYATSTKAITTGKWYMITVVYAFAKQQINIYINGTLDNVTNNIATPNPGITANMYIGSDNAANFTSYYMNGALNDMRIYNRALSVGQIQKLYISSN